MRFIEHPQCQRIVLIYHTFAEKFCNAINKHAPLKNKTIGGNQAPFMNKELAKVSMTRSRLKNIFIKDKIKQNWQAFATEKCSKLRKKAIKFHFAKVTGNGMVTDRCFWKNVEPFLNSKGDQVQQTIILYLNCSAKGLKVMTRAIGKWFGILTMIRDGKSFVISLEMTHPFLRYGRVAAMFRSVTKIGKVG